MRPLRAQWGKDYAHNMARIRQAVADTDGQYLVYDGQLIRAVFHAASRRVDRVQRRTLGR